MVRHVPFHLPPITHRAVIFAHFHPDGEIPAYTRRLIDFLASRAQRFIFISTCLNDAAARSLAASIEVIIRDNVGHDFMSYKTGWQRLGELAAYDEVLIANDSIYLAESARLEQTLAQLAQLPQHDADVWALTASEERSFHLQSFFIVFRRSALTHPALAGFWNGVEVLADKKDIIRRYERGLSQCLQACGMRLVAGYVADTGHDVRLMAKRKADGNKIRQLLLTLKMLAQPRRRCNPMHFLWDQVLMRQGILKLELLKRNPRGIDLDRLELELSKPAWQALQEDRAGW